MRLQNTRECDIIMTLLLLHKSLNYSNVCSSPSFFFSFRPCVSFTFAGEIFDCEQSFERILLGAIFGSNAPFFIAGWRSDFLDQVKCLEHGLPTQQLISSIKLA